MIYLFSVIGIGIILYGFFTNDLFYIGMGFAFMMAILAIGAKIDDNHIRNKR